MKYRKELACPWFLVLILMLLLSIACTDETDALEGLVKTNNEVKKTDTDKKDFEETAEKSDEIEKLKNKLGEAEIAKLKEKLYTHKDIENIKNNDERFEYVETKIEEQKEFIKFGLEMILDGLYQRQEAQKSKQPVFNLIYGYFLFGTARGDESKRNRGLQHIKRTIELDPNFEYAHYVMGDTFINKYMQTHENSHIKSAIEHYKKALDLRSSFYAVHRSLGVTYLETGNYEQAEEEINKAIELNKEDAQNWIALISINLRRGEYEKAENVIDDAQVSDKVKYQSYGRICLELGQKKMYGKAWTVGLKAFEMMKKLKGDEIPRDNWIQFYILMSKLAFQKADSEIETAIEFLDKVFEVENTNLQASNTLMMIAAQTKDIKLLDDSIHKWLEYIQSEPMQEKEENRVFDWITSLAKILVELDPNKIKGNKQLVLVLLKWAFSVRGDEEDEALKKAGLYLEWMFPLNPDPKNKEINYITDNDIKVIENPDDMKLIIKGLLRAAKSSQISVLKPTSEYLGAIVRAAKIDDKTKEFKEFVAEVMNLPAIAKNNQIKSYLCITIADFNDKSLIPYILLAMKMTLDTDSTSECHRLYPRAYRAVNALLDKVWEDRDSDRKMKRRQYEITEYDELLKGWLELLKTKDSEIFDKYSEILKEYEASRKTDKENS